MVKRKAKEIGLDKKGLGGILNQFQIDPGKEQALLDRFWAWELAEPDHMDENKKQLLAALVLICAASKNDVMIEKTLDFIAKAIISPPVKIATGRPPPKRYALEEKEEDKRAELDLGSAANDGNHDLFGLRELAGFAIDFALKYYVSPKKAIRSRMTYFLLTLLQFCSKNRINSEKFDDILDGLGDLITDKNINVRSSAIQLCCILLPPDEWELMQPKPTAARLLFLMAHDPSPQIRQEIVEHVTHEGSFLHECIKRTRDTSNQVRITAYYSLGEGVAFETIAAYRQEVLLILREGLRDRSPQVVAACRRMIIEKWLPEVANDPVKLLSALFYKPASQSTCAHEKLETELSMCPETQEVAKSLIFCILDEYKKGKLPFSGSLIDTTNLSPPTVALWRYMCEFYTLKEHESAFFLKNRAKYLPNTVYLCDMIGTYMTKLMQAKVSLAQAPISIEVSVTTSEGIKAIIFVIEQLLWLAQSLEVDDEAGRRYLFTLLQKFFLSAMPGCRRDEFVFIAPALKLMHKIFPNSLDDALECVYLNMVAETDDPNMALDRNLTILGHIMQNYSPFQSLEDAKQNSHMDHFLLNMVEPNLRANDPDTRALVVQCIAPLCIKDLSCAKIYLPRILNNLKYMSKMNAKSMISASARCLFDCALHFGFDALDLDAAFSLEHGESFSYEHTLSFILNKFGMADLEIQFTLFEGLSKLFLANHLRCHAVLKSMLKLYFDAKTADSLKQLLNVFLPTFSFSSPENQLFVANGLTELLIKIILVSESKDTSYSFKDLNEILKYAAFLLDPNNIPAFLSSIVSKTNPPAATAAAVMSDAAVDDAAGQSKNPHCILFEALMQFLSKHADVLAPKTARVILKTMTELRVSKAQLQIYSPDLAQIKVSDAQSEKTHLALLDMAQ